MTNLLARAAESTFWLARYMERVENLARILDVTETFARDQGGRNWLSVVQINADEKPFFAQHALADAAAVLEFYLLDADNPTSIQSSILAVHHNARSLRPLIPIEMWTQLNMFCHRLRRLTADDIASPRLSKLCEEIRLACQTHAGVVEGTFSRDEAWSFYWLGKELERADQTTRLLDIKYHLLLPRPDDVGSALDLSQWNAMLQAAAGYQAFRRLNQGRTTPRTVVDFLLFCPSYPRSVLHCARQADRLLRHLAARYDLTGAAASIERLGELRRVMGENDIDRILAAGLHEFIDGVQRQLGAISSDIAQAFFADRTAQSQSQGGSAPQ